MNLEVSPRTAGRLRDALASGRVGSADDLVAGALDRLDGSDEKALAEFREFLARRRAEADRGDFCDESIDEIIAAERRRRAT